jgi:hypothetical protein
VLWNIPATKERTMEFIELDTPTDFEYLEKGDTIIVKWSDYAVKHTPGMKKTHLYKIYDNKPDYHEIICQKRGNHYFNYRMFCLGSSAAEEVYKVIF